MIAAPPGHHVTNRRRTTRVTAGLQSHAHVWRRRGAAAAPGPPGTRPAATHAARRALGGAAPPPTASRPAANTAPPGAAPVAQQQRLITELASAKDTLKRHECWQTELLSNCMSTCAGISAQANCRLLGCSCSAPRKDIKHAHGCNRNMRPHLLQQRLKRAARVSGVARQGRISLSRPPLRRECVVCLLFPQSCHGRLGLQFAVIENSVLCTGLSTAHHNYSAGKTMEDASQGFKPHSGACFISCWLTAVWMIPCKSVVVLARQMLAHDVQGMDTHLSQFGVQPGLHQLQRRCQLCRSAQPHCHAHWRPLRHCCWILTCGRQ